MTNIFKLYPSWTCWLWVSILILAASHEVAGLFRYRGAIPLTWAIRDSIPAWLRWTLLGWMAYHFGILTNSTQPPK